MERIGVLCLMLIAASDLTTASECNERCFNCDDDGSSCRECVYGWYGHSCNSRCQNCWIGGCRKDSGICVQCELGSYKEDCRTRCPKNCKVYSTGKTYCRREDGTCVGCKVGWWGNTCKKRCSSHCYGRRCLQEHGHCTGYCLSGWCDSLLCMHNNDHCSDYCQVGWWGLDCTRKCSSGCVTGSFNPVNGSCINGCLDGLTSSTCTERCPGSCLKCHQNTRECQQCPPGLYRNNCTLECSTNCYYGNCSIEGKCMRGCVDGFTGTTCREPCPGNCLLCSQENSTCTKCKMDWNGMNCEKRKENTFQDDTGAATKSNDLPYIYTIMFCFLITRTWNRQLYVTARMLAEIIL